MENSDEKTFKRRILIGCTSAGILLVAGIICLQFFLNAEPPKPSVLSFGAFSTIGIMILLAPLIAAWGFYARVRCSDGTIKRNLQIIAALLIFWLFVVIIKYPTNNDIIVSLLWYCFYIPMTFIPSLCLFSAARAATLDKRKYASLIKRIILIVDTVLVVIVITNNFHHAVFVFDFSDPRWNRDYHYNIGYYIQVSWSLLQYLAFFALLFPAAQKQKQSAFIPVFILLCLGLAYCLLYALRHVSTIGTNISLVYTLLVLISLELLLDFKILPSYSWYGEVFSKLPFDIKLFNSNHSIVYETNCAAPLSASVLSSLSTISPKKDETVSFHTSTDPSMLFKAYSVTGGGTALLSEEISAINEQRKILNEHQKELRKQNTLLRHNHEVAAYLYQLESEQALFQEIEQTLESKVHRIRSLLKTLPKENDTESLEKRRENLMKVKLLVAYCKRKGSLVLTQKSDPDLDRDRVQLVFNETAADLRSLGIDCAALIETSTRLPVQTVSVLYDCLYDFAASAFASVDPILMLFVRNADEGVELRAQLQAKKINTYDPNIDPATNLSNNLRKRTKNFSINESKDCLTLSAIIKDGEI